MVGVLKLTIFHMKCVQILIKIDKHNIKVHTFYFMSFIISNGKINKSNPSVYSGDILTILHEEVQFEKTTMQNNDYVMPFSLCL